MTKERWAQIKEVFGAAREKPQPERSSWLDSACGGDDLLRAEIERLLAQDEESLKSPAAALLAQAAQGVAVGDLLSHYRVEAKIGEGGMGAVYRAYDTRLHRQVALKVLPPESLADPERRQRLMQEARAVAALNHPNICTLHEVGPNYLVMELIEGPTLAERTAKGAIPLQETLDIARGIADALEAAHEKGIVHRDLKPANIKLSAAGTVKVLDFGLAKAQAPAPGAAEDSPTVTVPATQDGIILGTPAYMSPEQAMGKPVDKRADIWSFGVVLWELLTGHRLFEGETVTHTLAGVLNGPIDFDQLPRETPAAIRGLLRRCLDRNAKNRLRDIGEARVAIEAAFQPVEPAESPRSRRTPFAWIAAAVFALSLGALAFVHLRQPPPERKHVRFQINLPEGELLDCKLSPDGKFLAFVTTAWTNRHKYWIRSLDGLDTRLLMDIEAESRLDGHLFWSWDGENVAFQSAGKLYKIARNGGPPVVLADQPLPFGGGVWLDSGVIVFGTAGGLFRLSSSGGALVKLDDRRTALPAWLPGRRFLYMRQDGIFAGSLEGETPVRILADRAVAAYVPPLKPGLPGHLLSIRGETLLAQSFNADKLQLQGDAVPVAERVGNLSGRGSAFTVSANGVLVFGRGSRESVLTWLDRAGKRLQTISKPFSLAVNPAIRLSPDDSQAIVTIAGADGTDLWIADLNRGTFSRFTFNGSASGIWSPDGRKILWAANDGKRYVRPADGSGKDELLFKNPICNICYLNDWSSDGRLITFTERSERTALDLWLVPTEGDRKPYPYLQSQFATYWQQISPDNRWMAYGSDHLPQEQIFVESIPAGKGRRQISTEGGDWPIWRRDGKELFYRQGTKLMAVPIRLTETSVESGKPEALFEVPAGTRFQVSRDGQRFLIALPVEGASTPLTVDTDWRAGLAK
jgi:eukaryotic-like serine/threonine-protein kinase